MKMFLLFIFSLTVENIMAQNNADTNIIKDHLISITNTENGFRTFDNLSLLNQTAAYINKQLKPYCDSVYYQEYNVGSTTYRNVIGVIGNQMLPKIIIGAHYDVCGPQEGADDNASGVVGLLELARLLKGKKLPYNIEFVAYTLEEPPYFKTKNMGSYVHAKSIIENNINVMGMLSLERIGYFSDEKQSQAYPLPFFSWVYGNKGDYITLVKKFNSKKFPRKFIRKFKKTKCIKTKVFVGPKTLTGIDFSDHWAYWKFGIPALMITDTAFYRNKNYHTTKDKLETLDLAKMSGVIDAVYFSLIHW